MLHEYHLRGEENCTKPLFRARDLSRHLAAEGVELHYQSQCLDAPTVAPGVIEHLLDDDSVVLMDVGGGSHGSHMIGQFAHILNRDNTTVFYLVNPYRPWSGNRANIDETMRRVLGTAGLDSPRIVANPNLGTDTDFETVCQGYKKMLDILPDMDADFICALDKHAKQLAATLEIPVFGIQLKTLPDWFIA